MRVLYSEKNKTFSMSIAAEKSVMANLLLDSVRVQDLPPQWAEQLNVNAEQRVEVFITTSTEPDRKTEFNKITQNISQQAKKAGLTEKKLTELLNE